ncbi:MAG: FliH/SctL family protein [Desulfobacteraceae bacterium]
MSDGNGQKEKAGKGGFTALDISTLENVDTDRLFEEEKRSPDYDRFKLLYDDPFSLNDSTDGAFKRLYEFETEESGENNRFTQLDYGGSKRSETASSAVQGPDQRPGPDAQAANGGSAPVPESGKAVDGDTGSEQADREASALHRGLNDMDDRAGADAAYNEGFEKGRHEGYSKGFEQGERDGFEQGFEKGMSEGFEQGEAEAVEITEKQVHEKLETLEGVMGKLDTCYEDMLLANEEKILDLLEKIMEKVVFATVETDRTVVKETIMDALEKLARPEEIVLLVSPGDYEYIEMVKEDFFEAVKSLKSVSVKSDLSIRPGGCRIESTKGGIQTDPEEKLQMVFDSIRESRKE